MSHKICFYIRVSTEEQAKNLEGSIKNQKERLNEAVRFKNLSENFGSVVSVFIDRAKSGKDTNRPELQKMIYEISQGNIDLVMVSEISRISRNMKDFSEIWELMKKHGCGFYSLRENFDTTTAAGEMVLYTIANIAQFERRQVSERVTANIKARAKRGLYNGGSVPLGYKLNPARKGYLEVDEEMAGLVRLCFESFLEKETLSQTARHLNDQGHKIKRWRQGGGRFKRLSHFSVDNLHKILTNKAYIGVKVYKDDNAKSETKAVWEPLVDVETFNRVGKILKDNHCRKKPYSSSRYPYLLSGIVFCKVCGDTMCGKSAHGNGGKIGYYEHSWATKRNSTLTKKTFKCLPQRVQAKKLEPLVSEKVEELLFKEDLLKRLFVKLSDKAKDNTTKSQADSYKAQIYGINSQMDALTERLSELPKEVPATSIYKQMKALEERRVELYDRLENLNHDEVDFVIGIKSYKEFLESLRHVWSKASHETKAKLIKRLVYKVEVGVDSVVIHYNVDKRDKSLKTKKPSKSEGFLKNSNYFDLEGSNSLTSGAGGGT